MKKARNQYNYKAKQTRTNFYHKKLEDAVSDSKKTYKTINKVLGKEQETILPTNYSEEVTANRMGEFYKDKITRIRSKINQNLTNNTEHINLQENEQGFFQFLPIGLKDLEKIIKTMKNKTSISDPIPTRLIKQNLETVLPLLQHIINSSIQI